MRRVVAFLLYACHGLCACHGASRATVAATPFLQPTASPLAASFARTAAPAATPSASALAASVERVDGRIDGRADGAPADVSPGPVVRASGPYELPFAADRAVYFAVPPRAEKGSRLIANLHGLCNPPGYACGYWVNAGSAHGFLVCPTGNATCGAGGPPSWSGSWAAMDRDLEQAIAVVSSAYPEEIDRDGATLTGFSKGGYAAPAIATMHPNRWRHLIIVEADVTLTLSMLRSAGVASVVLVGGERGTQIAGQRRTVAALRAQQFPAKLFVMPKAGHFYSANIETIMNDALDYVMAEQL